MRRTTRPARRGRRWRPRVAPRRNRAIAARFMATSEIVIPSSPEECAPPANRHLPISCERGLVQAHGGPLPRVGRSGAARTRVHERAMIVLFLTACGAHVTPSSASLAEHVGDALHARGAAFGPGISAWPVPAGGDPTRSEIAVVTGDEVRHLPFDRPVPELGGGAGIAWVGRRLHEDAADTLCLTTNGEVFCAESPFPAGPARLEVRRLDGALAVWHDAGRAAGPNGGGWALVDAPGEGEGVALDGAWRSPDTSWRRLEGSWERVEEEAAYSMGQARHDGERWELRGVGDEGGAPASGAARHPGLRVAYDLGRGDECADRRRCPLGRPTDPGRRAPDPWKRGDRVVARSRTGPATPVDGRNDPRAGRRRGLGGRRGQPAASGAHLARHRGLVGRDAGGRRDPDRSRLPGGAASLAEGLLRGRASWRVPVGAVVFRRPEAPRSWRSRPVADVHVAGPTCHPSPFRGSAWCEPTEAVRAAGHPRPADEEIEPRSAPRGSCSESSCDLVRAGSQAPFERARRREQGAEALLSLAVELGLPRPPSDGADAQAIVAWAGEHARAMADGAVGVAGGSSSPRTSAVRTG